MLRELLALEGTLTDGPADPPELFWSRTSPAAKAPAVAAAQQACPITDFRFTMPKLTLQKDKNERKNAQNSQFDRRMH
tara:strand:+ start:90 stop:323 length:234 start_codon:yes stop_codon:yes gene_type:complete